MIVRQVNFGQFCMTMIGYCKYPPGASYNPSFKAHQSLLKKAERAEERKKAKLEREKRLRDKYLPSKHDGITEDEKMAEMSQGLPCAEEDVKDEVEIKEEPMEVCF